ncbi:MAG: hypothetical protein K0S53_2317 [Bacteroidetes bacterium]|jgi:hypothetical protein|nr:hypothetical protein [Bacteroidota bacterium]MDF2450566.1 hypothetical protein [Bacteroidota bacterium]
MESKVNRIVPKQKKGSHTGARTTLKAGNREKAIEIFELAKQRLLNINAWQSISGKGSAEFKLTDKSGNLLRFKKPRIGNLIRIKLMAPENKSGSGYDWVRIEAFKHTKDLLKDEEQYGFRVRPVQNPFEKNDESAHFYTSAASSTFLLTRQGSVLSAMEIGRNEIPNSHPDSFLNKVRNVIVAIAAMAGLAHPQWKNLVTGILKGSKEKPTASQDNTRKSIRHKTKNK